MQLSKNFWLEEFLKSQAATRFGLSNKPSPEYVENLRELAVNILQPIRDHFKLPVIINSGYRSAAVNRAVGGSATSQHSVGEAADIEIPGITTVALAKWIQDNLNFDQLILEGFDPRQGPNSGWVHVSYSNKRARKSVLTATFTGGKASYANGINA